MSRNLYRVMHKAMRRDLFEVSSLIASTDFGDAGALAALRDRFSGMAMSLGHHAEMEDGVLHPLARQHGVSALEAIETEHGVLDAELDELGVLMAGFAESPGVDRWEEANDFYLRFNRFVSSYLSHADREERELMPALVGVLDEVELARIAQEDVAGPVEMLVEAMDSMFPLFNVEDRRQLLADVAVGLSPVEYERVAAAAEVAVGPTEWAKLAP